MDDGRAAREMARELLEAEGYRVILLEGPMGSAEVLRRERPDLVLVDVGMPAMTGDDVVRYLRRDVRLGNVPILFFSALARDELETLAESCGADGIVEKKTAADELVFTVRGFIGPAT
jgi:two-component system cell cycle response regulator DivK